MLCSISGTVPEEPVFCVKSGHIYEKRLVLKHLAATATEPVTGEACTQDDFVPVKSNTAVKPRPLAASTVGGLLSTLQNEWDGVMLETFQLRESLQKTRQELSQALYQHDAACRVIAKLVKERDQARAALTNAQAALAQRAAGAGAAAGDVEMSGAAAVSAPAGLTQETLQIMQDKYKDLTKWRKKRPVPAETAQPAAIASLAPATPVAVSSAGISCMEMASPRSIFNGHALAGCQDGQAVLVEASTGKTVASLAGQGKTVTGAAFSGIDREALVTGYADGSVRAWVPSTAGSRASWSAAMTLRPHGSSCVGVAALPSGDFAVSAAADGSMAVIDTAAGQLLALLPAPSDDSFKRLHGLRTHPDGLLVGLACNDGVKFVDLRTQAVAARIGNAAHGQHAVTALAFSENGYTCASTGEDGGAVTWDLRKAGQAAEPVVRTYSLPGATAPATSLSFDDAGYYLAVGGAAGVAAAWDIRAAVPEGQAPQPLWSHAGVTGGVAGVAWAPLAKALAVAGRDGKMQIFNVAA